MVRAAGLYPVLTPDKRKVAGSNPVSPTKYPMGYLHIFILLNFFTGWLYASCKVFQTPKDKIITRRMYALESWLIFGFFAIYMALTTIAVVMA
tara:strand:+ start:158 stop:436 length:279 start_codon:yes stop_codon:yes gene_type:complete